MTQGARAYEKAAAHCGLRDQEADVFRHATGALKAARHSGQLPRVKAIADNRQLWLTVTGLMRGIPQQIAFQPLEAQEKAIATRVDVTKFKDPKFVESFVQRYLLAANTNATGTSTTPDITTLAVQSQGLVV